MMNCDQAFESMTSLENASPIELERHLETCPRCREMAEVLSPVLGDLYSVRQILGAESEFPAPAEHSGVQVARRSAHTLMDAPVRRPRIAAASTAMKSRATLAALILLIGVSGGWGLSLLQTEHFAPSRFAGVSSSRNCVWKSPEQAKSHDPQTLTLTCVACHLPADSSH